MTRPAIQLLYYELRTRSMATSMTLAATIIGFGALILGDTVSRAFTIIGGSLLARLMGLLLASGGIITFVGIARHHTLTGLIGLVLVSTGSLIYGAGVIIGLHINGFAAGTLSLGLCLGSALRVITLASVARKLYDIEQ